MPLAPPMMTPWIIQRMVIMMRDGKMTCPCMSKWKNKVSQRISHTTSDKSLMYHFEKLIRSLMRTNKESWPLNWSTDLIAQDKVWGRITEASILSCTSNQELLVFGYLKQAQRHACFSACCRSSWIFEGMGWSASPVLGAQLDQQMWSSSIWTWLSHQSQNTSRGSFNWSRTVNLCVLK